MPTKPDDTVDRIARGSSVDRTPHGAGRAGTVRVVLTTVLAIVAVAAVVASVLLYGQVRDKNNAAADRAKAEQVASDYALKAANMDYRDLTPWFNAMKTGTTDELAKKFDSIADTMREVLTPLRMVTSGKLVLAKSDDGVNGIFQVKVVVDVTSTNVQAPLGSVATTVYLVSLDRSRNWIITQVGDPANPANLFSGLGNGQTTTAPATAAPTAPTTAAAGEPTAPSPLPTVPTAPTFPSIPDAPN